MEINRCYGCMKEIMEYPCPQCGYDPENTQTSDYALHPGAILKGKYLLGRVLGQGGFGITYVGWDLALERKVAIKEYFPAGQVSRVPGKTVLQWYTTDRSWDARQSGMEMFLKEARKMTRVDGVEQVVRVQDVFQENETAYIVMDFIEGETLKARLQRTGPLNWEEAKLIFLPVAEAMEKVHQAGLIHRDISPDNLMLTPEGGVKILDLGAAKDLNLNSGASSMQVAKGGFSPMEQYTQRGGSGEWTDVYALAATMYYSLTGVLPPAAVDRVEEDNLRWNLPQLQALPKNVTAALKNAMILRATERTQTMREFSGQLQGEALPCRKQPKQHDQKKRKRRLPAILWPRVAVVGGAVLLSAGLLCINQAYDNACTALQNGEYDKAYKQFTELGSYRNSKQRAIDTRLTQANELAMQGAYQEALEVLDTVPVEGTILRNETLLEWAEALISAEDYQGALKKLALLTEKTEETLKLEKNAHYDCAEKQAVGYPDRYRHFAAAGDYSDAEIKRRNQLRNWVNETLQNSSLSNAMLISNEMEKNDEDRDVIWSALRNQPFFSNKNKTSSLDIGNALLVRQTLQEGIASSNQWNERLKDFFSLLAPDNINQVIEEHPDLVESLWNYPVMQDLLSTGGYIVAALSGKWENDSGEYMYFSSVPTPTVEGTFFEDQPSSKHKIYTTEKQYEVWCLGTEDASGDRIMKLGIILDSFSTMRVCTILKLEQYSFSYQLDGKSEPLTRIVGSENP